MAISITHNLMAMNAERMLSINNESGAKSTEKLSSGYKINRAADDAAGLAISEKMRRQIRGLTQGVQNAQEGVGICQVADGALAEVNDMLHRISELSVKAANGTNTDSDRQAMQQEINQLLQEIDRIGNATQFNEKYIFKGTDIIRVNPDGSVMTEGDIPFEDFTIADVNLGESPFGSNPRSNDLQLEAIVDNPDSIANGIIYKLVYGNGSTSHSSIRLTYEKDGVSVSNIVSFDTLTPSNFSSGIDGSGNSYWTRDFIYENANGVGIKITQRIEADGSGVDEKNYHISYSLENTGNVGVNMDFMFHVDTAYNNNDRCEGYFVNGNRISRSCIYSKNDSSFTDGQTHSNILEGVPDSFSIVDVDRALAFSEKITFTGNKPDSLSVGHYNRIHDWGYYDSLDDNLGENMINNDLGFSLLWNFNMGVGSSNNVAFDYGVAKTEMDRNLQGVDIQYSEKLLGDHYGSLSLWIQSGAESGDGLWIKFDEMNTDVLGISRVDVSTVQGAREALDLVNGALQYISRLRSDVGAQQNRLEHIIANENNIVENTTSAESLIRDTDIATELVKNTNINVLQQVAHSVLTQANQQTNYVLRLLQ